MRAPGIASCRTTCSTCDVINPMKMSRLGDYIRRWQARPKVRPWALAGPIIVLLICLPLLRPLRHPASITSDEAARLETIRALVEHHTLALPEDAPGVDSSQLIFAHQKSY